MKAVASEIGITITGQANDIVDQMNGTGWTLCKDGVDARQKAIDGNFVIGGLKATSNGHVVVVVPGPLAHGKYPTAYWGSIGGVGKKNTTINWSWNTTDRDLLFMHIGLLIYEISCNCYSAAYGGLRLKCW